MYLVAYLLWSASTSSSTGSLAAHLGTKFSPSDTCFYTKMWGEGQVLKLRWAATPTDALTLPAASTGTRPGSPF